MNDRNLPEAKIKKWKEFKSDPWTAGYYETVGIVDMEDFIFKIRHYGIKRMFPKIVIKNVWISTPYVAYYQIKKENGIYHFRLLRRISKHLYVTTYRVISHGVIPSTVRKIS